MKTGCACSGDVEYEYVTSAPPKLAGHGQTPTELWLNNSRGALQ